MTKILFLLLSVWSCLSFAGSIGFNIQFTAEHVVIKNIGNEGAHRLAVFTLLDDQHWQALKVVAGDPTYVMPQQQIDTVRTEANTANTFKAIDPILVLFNDQSGSAMTQLAWRKAPPHALFTLSYDRQGTQLRIHPPSSDAASKIVRTHAIVVPYAGIAALAKPLQPIPTPPAPISMRWQNGNSTPQALWVETGEGLSGAWLLHESPNGELSLQVITDGKQRGSEQIPTWLLAVRKFGLLLANWLWVFGLLTMAFSVWLFKRQGKSPT